MPGTTADLLKAAKTAAANQKAAQDHARSTAARIAAASSNDTGSPIAAAAPAAGTAGRS